MADIDPTEWGRLQQTVETIASNTGEIKVGLAKQNGRVDNLEREFEPIKQACLPRRVNRLENWRAYTAGAIAVIVLAIGVIVKVVL